MSTELNTKMSTTIPFSGFYYSIHDSELDQALNQIFSDESGDPYETLVSKAFDLVDWGATHREYAKVYSQKFAQEFELKTLTFDELVCPKYYNFETDRIFCHIELSEILKMFQSVDLEALDKLIQEKFTSRSGFISHYRNALEEWPTDLAEWDHNQVGTLLEAYITQESNNDFDQYRELDILTYPSEVAYNILSDNLKPEAERLYKIADYLRQREARERA